MKTSHALYALLLLAGWAASAQAVPVLVSNGDARGNRDDFTGTVGTSFTIAGSDQVVNALGFEDEGEDGLAVAHAVGLWQDDGTLLASAVVAAGLVDTLDDAWRYVKIGSDITLKAGETYVVGARTTSGDGDGFTDTEFLTVGPRFAFGPGVNGASPVNQFTSTLPGLNFPDLPGGGDDLRWGPANATFIGPPLPAPEPVTTALFGLGLTGLGLLRRRKTRL